MSGDSPRVPVWRHCLKRGRDGPLNGGSFRCRPASGLAPSENNAQSARRKKQLPLDYSIVRLYTVSKRDRGDVLVLLAASAGLQSFSSVSTTPLFGRGRHT